MTASQILSIAQKKGIILRAQGEQLTFKAPHGSMTPELVEAIKTHKQDLLALLNLNQEQVKCLGVICTHAGYKQIDGSPCLWCQHENKLVLDMTECPHGAWAKDANGFPMPDR